MALLALGAGCSRNGDEPSPPPPSQSADKSSPKLIDVADAERLIASKQVVILDVRTPEEFAAGHIASATNLNFYAEDFPAKLQQLDKNQNYLVHCAVGGRSAKASAAMTSLGFKSVYDLEGGMKAWEKAARPIEK